MQYGYHIIFLLIMPFEFFENCNDSEFEIDNVKVRIRYIENDEEISEKQNNIKLNSGDKRKWNYIG